MEQDRRRWKEEETRRDAAAVEADVEMELAIELPSDPIELLSLQKQIRIDMAAALGVDVSRVGAIEVSAPG